MMSSPITDAVKNKYGAIAESALSGDHAGVRAVAEAFGYSLDELNSIPREANMGLSCGNPTAMASLKPGEVVVDLGCGGGLDVFLAAKRVGPAGRAIGIDMTPAMIQRARKNAADGGFANVEFHLASIDRLPLPDASVDVVISNCVINLAPDKGAVIREIARVLKPGGRLAVSDIALKRELPVELGQSIMAYVGCIAGAISIDTYRSLLRDAGFTGAQVIDSGADLNAYTKVENQSGCCAPPIENRAGSPTRTAEPKGGGCCGTLPGAAGSSCCGGEAQPPRTDAGAPASSDIHGDLRGLLTRYDINSYAASVKVFAVKP